MLTTELHDHLQTTRLLPPNSKLVVAVSGGVDSVSLLDLLHGLRDFYDWQIVIAHVDHKVRSDSHLDAELVAQLADGYQYPYYLHKLDGSIKSEAALRKARYEFLENLRNELNYDRIVTAHHMNDRIETAAFNAIRGADRLGLTSLRSQRDRVTRPLLPFAKAQLITYAALRDLPYREDSTNSNPSFSRNFVRHQLLPLGSIHYKNFNHTFVQKLHDLEQLNTQINSQLEALIDNLTLDRSDNSVSFKKSAFLALPNSVQPDLLAYTLLELLPGASLSQANIKEALKFIQTAKTGSRRHFKNDLHLELGYDTVTITCQPDNLQKQPILQSHLLSPTSPFLGRQFILRISGQDEEDSRDVIRLKSQPMQLFVRSRQPGDRMQPAGMQKTKKLQDIFVDKKVPYQDRIDWPVVVNEKNQIVWVPAVAHDTRFVADQKDPETIQVICEER